MTAPKPFAEVDDTELGPMIRVGEKVFEVTGLLFAIRDHLNKAHAAAVAEAVREAYERAAKIADNFSHCGECSENIRNAILFHACALSKGGEE